MSSEDANKELEEARALPYNARVTHAKWKVRNAAWAEVIEVVTGSGAAPPSTSTSAPEAAEGAAAEAEAEAAPAGGDEATVGAAAGGEGNSEEAWKLWAGENAPLFVSGVNDTNSAAQATAIGALVETLRKAESMHDAIVSAHGAAICKVLGSKGLSGRPNIVTRAKEAFMLFVELGRGDIVTEALVATALPHKVSKVVLNAVETFTAALKTYGSKALDPKPLLKEMPKLFEAKDVKVRGAAKELTAELCRWIKPNVIREVLLANVREATKKDVESLIAKNGGEGGSKAAPAKALRGEEAPEAEAGAGAEAKAGEGGNASAPKEGPAGAAAGAEEAEAELDAFDLSSPVDVLSDLEEFWAGVTAKKWSTRRDALLSLKQKASVPKIEPGDFLPVVKELKKVITRDSNVACVNAAIECIGALASGLRKAFKSASKLICPCLLDKFKEKSTAVTKSIHLSLASCIQYSVSLGDVQDDFVASIQHKNPKNRTETLKLCDAVLELSKEKKLASKVHGSILAEAAKATQDSSSAVRDAALALVTQFARVAGSVGDIEAHIGSMDASRKAKIEALLSKGEAEEKSKKASASAAAATEPAKAGPGLPKIESHAINDDEEVAKDAAAAPEKSSDAPKKESPKPKSKLAARVCGSRKPQIDNAVDEFKALVGEETFEGLKSTLWKDRLLAIKDVREKAKSMCVESETKLDVFVAALSQVPGWGDSNFQVLLNVFEIFTDMIQSKANVSRENVEFMVTGCVEKIADVKLNEKICDLMDECTKLAGPEVLVMKVVKKAGKHKNPKVLLESLEWVLKALTDTSSKGVDPKAFIEAVKDNLGNSNPNIRLATSNVLATVIAYRGAEHKAHLGEVKPTIMANIDSAISDLRDKGIAPTSPRKSPKKKQKSKEAAAAAEAAAAKNNDPNLQLPAGLLEKMSNANWKVRKEAVEELMQLVRTRKELIKPNISSLLPALRLRLHDANKNLVVSSLEILQHFPRSFEKSWERYNKMIIMDVLKVLCDNKKTVREAGVLTLHYLSDGVSLKGMHSHFLIFVSDSKTNVDGKISVLTFLNELVAESALPFEECLSDTLTVIADCLLGKALNLREAATSLLKALGDVFLGEKVSESAKNLSKAHSEPIVLGLSKLGLIAAPPSVEKRPRSAVPSRSTSRSASARPATAGAKLTPKTPKSVSKVAAVQPEADSFVRNDNKAERARKAPKRSMAKPLIEDIQRPETLRNLQSTLSQYVTKNLCGYLFHSDFKKHCTAVEIISTLVSDSEGFQGVFDNLDLLFQWFSYRICEGNMQVLVKILDLLGVLTGKLKAQHCKMSDYEANMIIPCLVEKCGHNNDRIRQTYKDLLAKLAQVYNSKAAILMILKGMFSKNHRTKLVCLEALDNLHQQNETDFHTSKVIKEIAILVSERDIVVKNTALTLMANIYSNIGSQLWKYLSSIPDSAKATLEMKFKSLDPASTSAHGEEAASAKTPTSARRPRSASERGARTPGGSQAAPAPATPTSLGSEASSQGTAGGRASAAASLWNRSMVRVSSSDLKESIEGMKQLCHILLDFAKKSSDLDVATMVDSADKLVCKLSDKVKLIFDKAIEDLQNSSTRTAEEGSSRGCKYVLNTLMHTFQLSAMAASVSEPTLRKIMKNLLILLLNEAIPSLEEGGQLLKALNVLMLKILENGNRTSTFLSLLWLLGEGTCNVDQTICSKFSDLIIKCLIKQTKHLSASVESVNLEGILAGIHGFLSSLDSGAIRQRLMQDDKPLRMVKTILHELCKLKGKDIYSYLLNIPRIQGKKQLIYTYVDLYVHTTSSTVRPSSNSDSGASSSAGEKTAAAAAASTTSSEPNAQLVEIFKKIGDDPQSKEGLEELHRFQREFPRVDIEPHLRKTSPEFQEYIRNGLSKASVSAASSGSGRGEAQAAEARKSPLTESKNENTKVKPRAELPSIQDLKARVERAKMLLNSTAS